MPTLCCCAHAFVLSRSLSAPPGRSSKKRQRVTQSTKGDASKGTCAVAARMLELLEEAIAGVEAPRL